MAINWVPDHIPPEMVRDFSLFKSPGMLPAPNGDPHAAVACVHAGPPIFYSPYNTRDGRAPGSSLRQRPAPGAAGR